MFGVFSKKPKPPRAKRRPHDVVEFDGLTARMWDYRDVNGRRHVAFSLHKLANVKGEGPRPVNSFEARDVTSLVGLSQTLCEWYLLDKSTPEPVRQELDSFNRVLSEFRDYAMSKGGRPLSHTS
ncbi:MAG: hypothetical protein K2V38_16775 [Gemmataceae bacterium]|nr:hypothetical protein [Gemmataceae bacterium]